MMGLQNFRTMEQVPLFNIRCRYNYGYKNIKEISVAEAHKNLVTVIVNRSCLLCLCCASSSFFSIMSSKKTVNKCSVPGCMDQTSKRHRFPLKDPALMQNWLDNIANPVLDNLLAEQVYASYYVCDNHFNDNVKVPGTKRGLKADAVPTLYLPESGVVKASSEPSLVESTTVDISEPVAPLPGPSRYPKLGAFTCLEMEPPQKKQKIGDEGFTNVPDVELEQEILVHRRMSTPPRRTKGTAIVYPVKLKRSILKKVNATRQAQLTPRCKVFYKEIIDWSRKNSSMQRRVTSFQKRLHNAEEVLKSAPFEYFQKFVNKNTYNFIMQQIRTQTQKPKSRRFTLEEKIMSLTFLKAGGRGYRLLSKIFCLPSTRTLRNLSNRLHLKAGINEHLFKSLEESCSKMKDAREKYCCLIFDEISISPSLTYRSKNDDIVGLEDDGSTQKQFMADHANVFMLKGIFKQWKQPLIYTFSSGPIKSMALKQLLQLAIRKCHSINLKVVATICDQGTNNVKTIKDLMTETDEEHKQEEMRHEMIKVDGAEVIPLYDVPHLFKGLRNNLLVKDLHFKMNGEKMVAKWDHIKQFYFLDMSDNVRLCPKLTDRHVLSSKINKMKVSSCTQVFSHQVGALMLRISSWAINDRLGLDEKAADTARLLLFLDKLFDSLNGNSKNAPSSKPLKGGVKIDSPHRDFWLEARNILNSMKFYCPKKKQFVSNPSIKN